MKPPTSRSAAPLYARCNADLSAEGLSALGCGNMDPPRRCSLDGVDQIEDLLKIGLTAGEKIQLEHFGPFAQQEPPHESVHYSTVRRS